jgi:hypothetical protein
MLHIPDSKSQFREVLSRKHTSHLKDIYKGMPRIITPVMASQYRVKFENKMWPPSKTNQATTIPKRFLALQGAPTPTEKTDVKVVWSNNPETGGDEVDFEAMEQEA